MSHNHDNHDNQSCHICYDGISTYKCSDCCWQICQECLNCLSTHNFNKLSNDIILFTDKIFYMNGIYDKLYYDSSLINNKIIVPLFNNISFFIFELLIS